jgi:tRNA G26 N,N-dimethylase Trm1
MTYLHCPRCRLAVRCRASYLTFTNCPRCIARAAIVSPMFSSPLDGTQLRATDRAQQDAPQPRTRRERYAPPRPHPASRADEASRPLSA